LLSNATRTATRRGGHGRRRRRAQEGTAGDHRKAGRRTLTPPDPQLKGAWYPGGFNPCTYQVKKTVPKFAFQVHSLHRYSAARVALHGALLLAAFVRRVLHRAGTGGLYAAVQRVGAYKLEDSPQAAGHGSDVMRPLPLMGI
jgi:hypothetical protein